MTDKTYWGDGIHQEVCLFYWYGCETCFEASKTVYPLLKEKLPSGIKLHYLPLVSAHPSINANLEAHARMALTLQAMGKEDGLSEDLYKLIAGAEGKILITPEAQADFLAGYGVSREQYLEIWNSAQTDETIRKLKDFQEAKGIDKVPKAVINGSLYYNINTKRPDMTVSKIIEQLKFGRI
ncbi:MAG: hypothetical protein LBK52_06840 [Deltaproteobacteria bacterium]|nr:hypothetical protein [Deltaproteobacteria bacterium]